MYSETVKKRAKLSQRRKCEERVGSEVSAPAKEACQAAEQRLIYARRRNRAERSGERIVRVSTSLTVKKRAKRLDSEGNVPKHVSGD